MKDSDLKKHTRKGTGTRGRIRRGNKQVANSRARAALKRIKLRQEVE